MSGYTLTQPELFYSLPAVVTKNTYTTQAPISAVASTSIPRCVIPALYFSQVGKSVHFEANGTIGSAAGTATFIFAGGLDAAAGTIAGTGGGTMFTTNTLTPTTTTVPWTMTVDLVCQAVGNLGTTIQVSGEVDVHGGATSTWSTSRSATMFSNSMTGMNNEISLYLELFGTWSVSNVGNTTTLQQLKVYLEN